MLWRFPYKRHNDLLLHITSISPLGQGIAERFLKHVHTGFNRDNILVKIYFSKHNE